MGAKKGMQPLLLLLALSAVRGQLPAMQQEKMKTAMANLLEISQDEILAPRTRTSNVVSGYMRRLYAAAAGKDGMPAGTIRSIAPVIDVRDGVEVLVFPLGQLRDGDHLLRAEFHMLGAVADKAARILQPEALHKHDHTTTAQPLSVASIESDSVRWNALRPVLRSYSSPSRNLVIRLHRRDGRKPRPLAGFVRRHSPFITVHTRGPEEEDLVENHVRRTAAKREKRDIAQEGYFNYGVGDVDARLERARSEYLSHGPTVLNTSVKKRKFTRHRYEKKKAKQPWYGFNEKEERNDNGGSRLIHVGGEEANVERQGKTLDTTTAVNSGDDLNVVLLDGKESEKSICSKRGLTVDFAEIGWGEWVIAPKSFEADFCAGECPFPLPKEAHASNHALVQSVLSSSSSGLPAVCCAPDRMDSLTLLYFDQNRNIVLRNFPRMIVSSCGCI